MQDPKTILPAAALVSLFKDTLVLPEKEIKSKENEDKPWVSLMPMARNRADTMFPKGERSR